MKIDLKANTRKLRARLAVETDFVCRRNLATVIRHIEAEIANKVDDVMDTMVSEPVYHAFFGNLAGGPAPAPKDKHRSNYISLRGGAAVRDMYRGACGARLVWTHFDPDKIVVDRGHVVTEGVMHLPYPGSVLGQMGISVDDPAALYLAVGRIIVFWPFDANGLLQGEDIYIDPTFFDDIAQRKLEPDPFLPPYEDTVELPSA